MPCLQASVAAMTNRTLTLCTLVLLGASIIAAVEAQTDESTPAYSCTDESDCTVKNVGNCCGYYPKCVNVDYIPDLEGVQAWCRETDMASPCGWSDIDACVCNAGNCEGVQYSGGEGVEGGGQESSGGEGVEDGEAQTDKPTPDYSCTEDSDCAEKNVENCCGYYPECVNVDYVPDPEGVQAWCRETGMASPCGWSDIDSCVCNAGNCEGVQYNGGEGVERGEKESSGGEEFEGGEKEPSSGGEEFEDGEEESLLTPNQGLRLHTPELISILFVAGLSLSEFWLV